MIEKWILNYTVLSTIVLGCAWLLSRTMPREWHAGRDLLWKTALVGGLAAATLATGLQYGGSSDPFGNGSGLVSPAVTAGSRVGPGPQVSPEIPMESQMSERQLGQPTTGETRRAVRRLGELQTDDAQATSRSAESHPTPSVIPPASTSAIGPTSTSVNPPASNNALHGIMGGVIFPDAQAPPILVRVLLLFVSAGIILAAVRLVRSLLRVRRCLRGRRPILQGGLHDQLRTLLRSARIQRTIRLSDAPLAPAPLAVGRNEICVPAEEVETLSTPEQRSALAHELAHLERRDPLWHTAAHILESIFFFQPLHRTARRTLQREAEFLCDDWAVSQTGNRLDLARCLASVAEWSRGRALPTTVSSMAGSNSLLPRVQRLLGRKEKPMPGIVRIGIPAGLGGLALAATLVLPDLTPTGNAAVAPERSKVAVPSIAAAPTPTILQGRSGGHTAFPVPSVSPTLFASPSLSPSSSPFPVAPIAATPLAVMTPQAAPFGLATTAPPVVPRSLRDHLSTWPSVVQTPVASGAPVAPDRPPTLAELRRFLSWGVSGREASDVRWSRDGHGGDSMSIDRPASRLDRSMIDLEAAERALSGKLATLHGREREVDEEARARAQQQLLDLEAALARDRSEDERRDRLAMSRRVYERTRQQVLERELYEAEKFLERQTEHIEALRKRLREEFNGAEPGEDELMEKETRDDAPLMEEEAPDDTPLMEEETRDGLLDGSDAYPGLLPFLNVDPASPPSLLATGEDASLFFPAPSGAGPDGRPGGHQSRW